MLDFGGRKDTDAASRRGSMPLSQIHEGWAGNSDAVARQSLTSRQVQPAYFARQAHRHARSAKPSTTVCSKRRSQLLHHARSILGAKEHRYAICKHESATLTREEHAMMSLPSACSCSSAFDSSE